MEHTIQEMNTRISDVDKHAEIVNVKLEQLYTNTSSLTKDLMELRLEMERQKNELLLLRDMKNMASNHTQTISSINADLNSVLMKIQRNQEDISAIKTDIKHLENSISQFQLVLNELPLKYEQKSKPLGMMDFIKLGPSFITVFTAICVIIYYVIKHLGIGGQ